ncbi:O-antigen polysaccharide polymerase Wzy [Planococcus kocurii]|uniref:O-antigen polysaccharide polymerase Wzy n=1 Tax=Planococcus kocurii TaxID=1374 RepID=UPI003D016F3E
MKLSKTNLFKKYTLLFFTFSFWLFFVVQYYSDNIFNEYINLFLVITIFIFTYLLQKKIYRGFFIVIILYLAISHLGIIFVDFFLNDLKGSYSTFDLRWYYKSVRELSVVIVCIAISTMFLAANFKIFFEETTKNANLLSIEQEGNKGLFYTGVLLISSFLLYMVFASVTGRIPLFGGYIAYYTALDNAPEYTYFIFLLSIGVTFFLANGSKNQLKKFSILIILAALILISAGNRGEILYPLAAGFGVLLYRGLKVKFRLVIIILLVVMLLIPFIRDFRSANILEYNFSEMNIRWSDGIFEMGYTLRPLNYTVEWIVNGEEYADGNSYRIPIQRLAGRIVPIIERPEIRFNRYSFRDRLPTMGYSIVAEAFFNFGVIGVILIFSLLGGIFTKVNIRLNFIKLTFLGAFASLILNHIRNAFAFIPGNVLLICVFLMVGFVMNLFIKGKLKW